MTPRSRMEPPTPQRSTNGRSTDSGLGRSIGSRSTWDSTPSIRSSVYDEVALEYPEEYPGDEEDRRRWEEEQAQLDRDWYSMEESGVSTKETKETRLGGLTWDDV